jgi:hypothetical protein
MIIIIEQSNPNHASRVEQIEVPDDADRQHIADELALTLCEWDFGIDDTITIKRA